MAEQHYCLSRLVNDPREAIRVVIAEKGQYLDVLVEGIDECVRCEAQKFLDKSSMDLNQYKRNK